MDFFVLNEGTYAIDRNKNFTLFNAELQNKSDFKGCVFLDIQAFLVITETDVILLDSGLGQKTEEGSLKLFENLKQLGILPNQVTKVLLSHLHKDHVGGLVRVLNNTFEINFPNAVYYISKPEWDWIFELNSENFNYKALNFLEQSKQIQFIEGNGIIDATISYELTGGHTPFHTVYHLVNNEQHIFFGGDILTMPQQIGSTLLVKSDKFPKEANAIRQKIVDRAITENWTCLFYHGSKTKFGKISFVEGMYKIINP